MHFQAVLALSTINNITNFQSEGGPDLENLLNEALLSVQLLSTCTLAEVKSNLADVIKNITELKIATRNTIKEFKGLLESIYGVINGTVQGLSGIEMVEYEG